MEFGMRFLRFVFPFLFELNWDEGRWELSRPRLILACTGAFLFVLAFVIAYWLQAPITYHS